MPLVGRVVCGGASAFHLWTPRSPAELLAEQDAPGTSAPCGWHEGAERSPDELHRDLGRQIDGLPVEDRRNSPVRPDRHLPHARRLDVWVAPDVP